MRKICVVCQKETIVAGTVNEVTHGVCETGICEKTWNDWMDMPSPKPELRVYFKALMAGGQSQGGKVP